MAALDNFSLALEKSGLTRLAGWVRPALDVASLRSLADWHRRYPPQHRQAATDMERRLIPPGVEEFVLRGYCWPDRAWHGFHVDFLYGGMLDGERWPNWRERLACPACGFNNRQRGALHGFELGLQPARNARIYMTEQATGLYSWVKAKYPGTVGSEFLDPAMPGGTVDARGIRHEDVTRLSFDDASFDYVLSFDVFEHVPGYRRAFAECARVLKPGGKLLFSVPFEAESEANIVRATAMPDGSIVHHHPPEYHGDPVRPGQGVLCYRHFGWQVLDDLRQSGFADAHALGFRSISYGYLGGETLLFVATK